MRKVIFCVLILNLLTGCSEVLLLGSIGGTVVSQAPAVKAYNGIDTLTIMKTKKGIKQHAYEKLKGENDR